MKTRHLVFGGPKPASPNGEPFKYRLLSSTTDKKLSFPSQTVEFQDPFSFRKKKMVVNWTVANVI
jgi:hypothetical protein